MNEASRYRGSSDILGGVDLAFALSRLPAGKAGDSDAVLLKLQCFKSRFASEFAITLRPELESRGDFALADPPQVSREAADMDTLRRLIATEPGLSQREVLRRAGLAQHRGIDILRREEGRMWRAGPGRNRAICYYPQASEDQSEEGGAQP